MDQMPEDIIHTILTECTQWRGNLYTYLQQCGELKRVCKQWYTITEHEAKETKINTIMNAQEKAYWLLRSVQAQHIKIIALLLRCGADKHAYVQWVDPYGYIEMETPWLCAIDTRRIDIVQLLLTHGACIDSRGDRGFTALMKATCSEDVPMVEFLLREGADSSIATGYPVGSVTAYDLAKSEQVKELIKDHQARGIARMEM